MLELSYAHPYSRRKDRAADRQLARGAKLGLTEAVHVAVSNEIRRQQKRSPIWERTKHLRKRVRGRVKTMQPATKRFRDGLDDEKDKPAQELPASYLAIADLIGSIDDPRLPRDLSARKKHYLKATGYGRTRRR